jgi:hypothetical protein
MSADALVIPYARRRTLPKTQTPVREIWEVSQLEKPHGEASLSGDTLERLFSDGTAFLDLRDRRLTYAYQPGQLDLIPPVVDAGMADTLTDH